MSQNAVLPAGLRRIASDWRGAVLVGLTAVLTSGVFSMLVGFGAKQRSVSVTNTLTIVGALWTGAFGAGSGAQAHGSLAGLFTLSGTVDVGFVPLTITLVTAVVTIAVFRRVTRDYARARDGLVDAVVAAALAAVLMLLVALLLRSDRGDLVGELGSVPVPPGVDLGAGPHVAAAALLTFVFLVAVLGVTVLLRRDWLASPTARRVHDRLSAPLAGIGWLLALTPAAGAVVAMVVLVTGRGPFERLRLTGGFDARDWLAVAVLVVAYAANIGLWALTLGAAGRLQVSVTGLGQHTTAGGGLTYVTGHHVQEPGLWVCVLLAPAMLAVSAYVAARRASRWGSVWPALGLWLLALVLLVPVLLLAGSVYLRASGTGLQPVGGLASGLLSNLDCAHAQTGLCRYLPDGVLTTAQGAADALSGQQSARLVARAGPSVLTSSLLLVAYAAVLGLVAGLVAGRPRAR